MHDINRDTTFVQPGEEKATEEDLITISAVDVEKTDPDSSQMCTAKTCKGIGMGCKSRWDNEVRPR